MIFLLITAYEKQLSFLPDLLLMIFAEVTFCTPINLEQPVMVFSLFPYLSAKLWNALPVIYPHR